MRTFLVLFLVLFAITSGAQTSTKRDKEFNLDHKVAIQGYDPAAYFLQKKAVKGKSSLFVNYEGVIYYFSSVANKDTFLKNPASFEPQFGGWCAFAMGDSGDKVEVNPETFKILDGKLYLFYNAFFNNTLKSWNKDEAKLKVKAEHNWIKIYK